MFIRGQDVQNRQLVVFWEQLAVNGGEKLWRLAVRGGRLNCATPKCSVVDFVIRCKPGIPVGQSRDSSW